MLFTLLSGKCLFQFKNFPQIYNCSKCLFQFKNFPQIYNCSKCLFQFTNFPQIYNCSKCLFQFKNFPQIYNCSKCLFQLKKSPRYIIVLVLMLLFCCFVSQEDYCEHRSAVSYARFSNSGQYIASVDVDGVVKQVGQTFFNILLNKTQM